MKKKILYVVGLATLMLAMIMTSFACASSTKKGEVTINVANFELEVGSSKDIELTFSDEEERDVTFLVIEGKDFIEIEGNKVKAIAEGVSKIKVTAEGNVKEKTFTVTVKRQDFEIKLSDVQLVLHDEIVLMPTTYPLQSDVEFTYKILTGEDIVSLNGNKVKGEKKGVATIECRETGTDKTKTITVTVSDWIIVLSDIVLDEGDTYILSPTTLPKNKATEFVYTVTDGRDKISIEGDTITAIKAGEATLVCKDKASEVFVAITITVNGWEIILDDISLYDGEKVTLTASTFPENKATEFIYNTMTGSAYVVVTNSGQLTAIKEGVATVRCRDIDEKKSKIITVTVTEWKIIISDVYLEEEDSSYLNATSDPEHKAKGFTYSIVSGFDLVDLDGNKITAKKAGEAIIKCTETESKKSKEISVVIAGWKIVFEDISLYEGDEILLSATTFPESRDAEFEFEVILGEENIVFDNGKITAVKAGEVVVECRDKNSTKKVEATITIDSWEILHDDVVMYVGQKTAFSPRVTAPNRNLDLAYEVKVGGEGILALDGNEADSIGVGITEVYCWDRISGKSVSISVEVIPQPTIKIDAISITLGGTVKIEPKSSGVIGTPKYTYQILEGSDKIKLEKNEITALQVGLVRIKAEIVGSKTACEFSVNILDGYTLTINDCAVVKGETFVPTLNLYPSIDNMEYEFSSADGGIVYVVNNELMAVSIGEATITCNIKGINVSTTFIVTVQRKMLPVPDGYVQISEYLYATKAGGRYKGSQNISFFTPLVESQIYYTTDCSPAIPNVGTTLKYSFPIILVERTGNSSTHKLMQQVDGVLSWAGTNKNMSTSYVNNMQNTGNYYYMNQGYVFNLVVAENGMILDKSTQSYIIFDSIIFDDMPIIALSMPEEYWFDGVPNGQGASIYNNIKSDNTARGWLEFFDTDDSFAINTQVKIAGGWSRGFAQRTLHLNFNRDETGEQQKNVKFEIFGDRKTQGDALEQLNKFSRFRLHNGGSTHESWTRMNDAFLHELAKEMNVSTTAFRPCVVYLNGEFWGMYHLREHYSDAYFATNYDVKKSSVQYFDYTGTRYNVSDGDPILAGQFIDEMNAYLNNVNNNFANDSVFNEFFNKYVDEASLMDLMIIQSYSGNWDFVGNGNNHRAWRVITPKEGNAYSDGKLRFAIHDLDMGMQGNNALYGTHLSYKPYHANKGYTYRNYNIFNRALANEGFRQRLYDRCLELTQTTLNYDNGSKVLDKMSAMVRPALSAHITRWAQGQSVSGWEGQLMVAKNWMRNRNEHFLSATKKALAICDEEITPQSGDYIIYYKDNEYVNQFNVGNGSQDPHYKFALYGLSVHDYEISYTMINNGMKSCSDNDQFHLKVYYGNTYHATRINPWQSNIWTEMKESGYNSSSRYFGTTDFYEGCHKIRMIKRGTQLQVLVNDKFAYAITVPDHTMTGVELYQHNANMIYRNLTVKML